MALIYNATFDKNTRKLSFEDKAGNEIYSFTVPERVPVDDITKPLTFKATQNGSTVTLKQNGSPTGSFQTSNDGGKTWVNYTLNTAIALNIGDEVSFRAKADRTSAQTSQNYFQFMMTGKIEAWHNVMSLYRTNDFATYDTVVNYAFAYMFKVCKSLTKAPILPATTLAVACYDRMFSDCLSLTKAPVLPATTLFDYCYQSMFSGCSSLTKAPALPATTLSSWCYCYMFYGCKSLTKAPALPATTLASSCYESMFSGCSSLTEAPALPATTLARNCYYDMFGCCESLTKAPDLPATTLAQSCYNGILYNCYSLTKAPDLPATTLALDCYGYMFYGCRSLTKVPALPATTLAPMCYRGMFSDCQSLKEVRISATTKTGSDALTNWLKGVAATGDFYCDPDATIFPTDSVSGIPANWKRHNIADYPN